MNTANLTTFDFQGKDIHFMQKKESIWVNITDISSFAGKKIKEWYQLPETVLFLNKFYQETGGVAMISYLGAKEIAATWAIDKVAIEYAGWCSNPLVDWMLDKFDMLKERASIIASSRLNKLDIQSGDALESIRQKVVYIESLVKEGNLDLAHRTECSLRDDFIGLISEIAPQNLANMAKEVLKTDKLHYRRWDT
jgi:hypothetical protein